MEGSRLDFSGMAGLVLKVLPSIDVFRRVFLFRSAFVSTTERALAEGGFYYELPLMSVFLRPVETLALN